MADAILMKGGAGGVDCDSATAGKPQILTPYTAGIAGYDDPQQGSMPDRSGWASSIGVNGKVMIPNGYHNGAGYVNQNIPVYGGATLTPGTSDQTIAAGRYLTGDIYVPGSGNLQSQYIANGVNIFGVTGNIYRHGSTETLYNSGNFYGFWRWGMTSICQADIKAGATGAHRAYMSGSDLYVNVDNYYNGSNYNRSVWLYGKRSVNLYPFNKIQITYYIGRIDHHSANPTTESSSVALIDSTPTSDSEVIANSSHTLGQNSFNYTTAETGPYTYSYDFSSDSIYKQNRQVGLVFSFGVSNGNMDSSSGLFRITNISFV